MAMLSPLRVNRRTLLHVLRASIASAASQHARGSVEGSQASPRDAFAARWPVETTCSSYGSGCRAQWLLQLVTLHEDLPSRATDGKFLPRPGLLVFRRYGTSYLKSVFGYFFCAESLLRTTTLPPLPSGHVDVWAPHEEGQGEVG